MSMKLNLEKSTQALVLNLQKAGIMTPPNIEVEALVDVTGSFDDEHRDGTVDSLLTRLYPWAAAFDPDKKMGVHSFAQGANGVQLLGDLTESNYYGYLPRVIFNVNIDDYPRGIPDSIKARQSNYGYGTDYSYGIEAKLKHLGWAGDTVKKAGFMGGLFGKKDQVVAGAKKRSLVIVITDGDNSDKDRTRQVLRESEARKDEVYFLFLGVANGGSTFPFLERLGDEFGNTGFVAIKNLKQFVALSDDQLNDLLLDEELLTWLKG